MTHGREIDIVCWKADTVAEEHKNDEVDTEEHSSSIYSALRPDSVEHHLVPVFASQYLTQFTCNLPSPSFIYLLYNREEKHTLLMPTDISLHRIILKF